MTRGGTYLPGPDQRRSLICFGAKQTDTKKLEVHPLQGRRDVMANRSYRESGQPVRMSWASLPAKQSGT